MNFSAVTKSIRGRLLLWIAFLLICTLGSFGITAFQLHRTNQIQQIDDGLQRRLAPLCGDLSAGPGGQPPMPPGFPGNNDSETDTNFPPMPPRSGVEFPAPNQPGTNEPDANGFAMNPPTIWISTDVLKLFNQSDTNGFYFIIWTCEGELRLRSTNAPDVKYAGKISTEIGPQTRMRGDFRETFLQHTTGYQVLVGRYIASDLNEMKNFALWLLAVGLAILAVSLGGGWILASRALRPVNEISAAASRISGGNLSERINVADTDNELGRLAQMLNATFARLEAAFAQQQRFTADAAHELRTPIAVLISEAQTTLARKRNTEDYEETIAAFLETSQQMRRLTESLLELARFDAGQEQLGFNPINVAETVRNCVELVRPLATGRNLQIHCDLAPAETRGNADLLGQVITNLLTNAIHHNKPQGEIRVSTRAENGRAIITVADNGEGIAAEDLPHIFERFYRADKSRSRASGRSGLGLAICQAIVAAHGGSIEVSSQPGTGATFTVRLAS